MSRLTPRIFLLFHHGRHALLAALILSVFNARSGAADEEWTLLFDGKDLNGFAFFLGDAGADNAGTFQVKDGTIVCTGEPAGYMYTKRSYSRFTIEYDWAFDRPVDLKDESRFHGNSGCLIHVGEKSALGVWPRSIEVQGYHLEAGRILPIPRSVKCTVTDDKAARQKALKPVGEWQKTRIEVDGGNMTISLNGTVVSKVRDCELTEGAIGFQSEGAPYRMKNIRIQVR